MQWMRNGEAPAAPKKIFGGEGSSIPKLTVETIDNHVYFYADVDSDRCLALIRTLRELDGRLRNEHASRGLPKDFPLTPIYLHIESPGGSLFSAFSMADQIAHLATPIHSIVEGYAASAATIISAACKRRIIMPRAFMMIHQLSSGAWGKYDDFQDTMKLLDMAMVTLTDFYVQKTKMTKKKVIDMLSRDSWLNAQDSLHLGLVDEIGE